MVMVRERAFRRLGVIHRIVRGHGVEKMRVACVARWKAGLEVTYPLTSGSDDAIRDALAKVHRALFLTDRS